MAGHALISLFAVLYFAVYVNAQWEVVEDNNFASNAGPYWKLRGVQPPIGRCGGWNAMGTRLGSGDSFGLSGNSGDTLQWGPYSYPNSPIQRVRVTINYLAIDSWDSSVSRERLILRYNGIDIRSWAPDHRRVRTNNCGQWWWPDTFGSDVFEFTPPAPITSLTFSMFSTLDQARDDESWALNYFKVEVIPSCKPCTDNNNQQCNGDLNSVCVNSGHCQRTCTCTPGYTGTQQLSGNAAFPGCTLINYCQQFGNQNCNGDPVATCRPTAAFQRTCTCPDAFVGTTALTNNQAFGGCVAKSGCLTFGPNGSNGKTANVISCTDSYNARTVTCAPGYSASPGSLSPSVLLTGFATFAGCADIDECAAYRYSSRDANTKSCENNNVNQRRITCADGFYAVAPDVPSIILEGSASFAGCTDIAECVHYRFSGKAADANSCVENTPNHRTITCNAGFYAIFPAEPVITLKGNALFNGCFDIDECAVYGTSGKPNARCAQGPQPNQRIITCDAGYYAVAESTPSILISGSRPFDGCTPIDMCKVYGTSSNGANTATPTPCVNSGVNSRTITCADGYGPIGGATSGRSITLVGPTVFAGCAVENPCTVHGYSGLPANTLSCVPINNSTRNITCQAGYFAVAPATRWVTLNNNQPFTGCRDLDECALYSFSGKGANTQSCTTPTVNARTITCAAGYYAIAPFTASISLTGDAAFQGCTDINECQVYRFSGRDQFTANCTQNSINTRTITCLPGYAATAPDSPTITLTGSHSFAGCTLIDTCKEYGYSGQSGNAVSCVSAVNSRTITCAVGFFAVSPDTPSIVLPGKTPFTGCKRIDNCALYGTNGKPSYVQSCVNTANNVRTITCVPGFYASGNNAPTVSLTGNAQFDGCKNIDECALHRFSNKSANTQSCTDGYNSRLITCLPGYYAVAPATATVNLTGATPFQGCFDINECAVYGNSSRPLYLESCVEGVNRRNLTCVDGALPLPIVQTTGVPRWVVLEGSTPFKGCEIVCGDGRVVHPETCDDGNREDGDGCSSTCQMEENWVCNRPGHLCCRYFHRTDGSTNIVAIHNLYCYDGWWTPIGYNRTAVILSDALIEFSEEHYLCGDFVVDHGEFLISGVTLHLAGSLTVNKHGTLHFAHAEDSPSQLMIYPPCYNDHTEDEVSFRIAHEDATLKVTGFSWDDAENETQTPPPVVVTSLCAHVRGTFNLEAEDIPRGSNEFPLIHSNSSCLSTEDDDDAFDTHEYDLPDGCSNLEVDHDKHFVSVTLNRKRLCPGQIVGIVIGCVAFVAIIAIGAVVAMGGGGGASGDAYVAL